MNQLEVLKEKSNKLMKERKRFIGLYNPETTPRYIYERQLEWYSKVLLELEEHILNEALAEYKKKRR